MSSTSRAITGVAFGCPAGEGLSTFAATPLSSLETERTLKSYNVGERIPRKGLLYMSAATKTFYSAALQAVEMARGEARLRESPERTGIYHGAENPQLDDVFRYDISAKHDGPAVASPMDAPNTLANAAAGELAIALGLQGPNVTVTCGPNSGIQAL